MALNNPNIGDPDRGRHHNAEVEARGVMAVPATFLGGTMWGSGKMTVEEILAKLDTGAVERAAAEISQKAPSRCWSSAAALPAPLARSTPRARASAPAWWPSVSAARCRTRWGSRTSSPSPRPKAPSWPWRWRTTSRITTWTS
jgi:alkyl hydroperoxide reductase subunit F